MIEAGNAGNIRLLANCLTKSSAILDIYIRYFFRAKVSCCVIKEEVSIRKFSDIKIIITLMIFLGVLCWFSYSVYGLNQTSIYAENGWLENTQVLTLTMACFTFFLPVVYQKRTDKLVLIFFSFLCLNFILREVDVEKLNIPDILILIGSGIGLKIILTIGFAIMFFYALFNRAHYINETFARNTQVNLVK